MFDINYTASKKSKPWFSAKKFSSIHVIALQLCYKMKNATKCGWLLGTVIYCSRNFMVVCFSFFKMYKIMGKENIANVFATMEFEFI